MKLLKQLESESKAITEDIVTLTIYSGQSYEQMWNTSYDERQIFVKILKDKINLDRGIKPKEVLTQGMF